MEQLRGKRAVVTGATGGIGFAIALALAREGVEVCAIGRNQERLARLRQEIAAVGSDMRCLVCDLAQPEELQATAKHLHGNGFETDILIHSAGYYRAGVVESTAVEELDRHYVVNVRAPFAITQALLPSLRERRGHVVFINSSVCRQPGKAGLSAYSASKCALEALANCLRSEVNSDLIRVLSIFPGRTASGMQRVIQEAEGREYHPEHLLQTQEVASVILHALRQPPTAEVTDVSIRPFRPSPIP